MTLKEKTKRIFSILSADYPAVQCQLNHEDPFQLLIATILSAQCTDARVNQVTPKLFSKFMTPQDFLEADNKDIEKEIFSTGFYVNKAKSIKNCCKALVENFNGKVPSDFEKLISLPGVGRKTASVVAGNAFNIPAIAVDTHVNRVSNRLGLTSNSDPEKIEFDLKSILPEDQWVNSSHYLIMHGRNTCNARNPKCNICKLNKYCDYYNSTL